MSSDEINSNNPFEFKHEEVSKPKPKPIEPITSGNITLVPINFSRDPIKKSGTSISLNRATIDESDASLSRGTHVNFTMRNGKWYIDNLSSNQSTFIQVTEATEIKSGTLISLGENKVFKFYPQ